MPECGQILIKAEIKTHKKELVEIRAKTVKDQFYKTNSTKPKLKTNSTKPKLIYILVTSYQSVILQQNLVASQSVVKF